MRKQYTRGVAAVAAALALAACASHAQSKSGASPSPDASVSPQASASASAAPQPTSSATPAQLGSCETHELHVDGVDLTLTSNLDATLATVVVVSAPSDAARAKALARIHAAYGDAIPDKRTEYRSWHLGIARLTDMCGRPVMPSSTPSPQSS